MSTDDDGKSFPQSMRHKRILDAAEENPGASVDELASTIPSATPELIERVLDEYGDPAAEGESANQDSNPETATAAADTATGTEHANSETAADETTDDVSTDSEAATDDETTPDETPSLDDLLEKQRELIEVVAARPQAAQKELAAHFDVTRATISRWASEIEGFEWRDRESYVESVFDDPPTDDASSDHSTADAATTESNRADADEPEQTDGEASSDVSLLEAEVESLRERVTDIERSSSEEEPADWSVFEDPELVHKIVHACLESGAISDEEELAILRELLT